LQEQPVALTNPAQPAPLAQERLQKAKREAAEKRKAQERKQRADRRRQQLDSAAETRVIERRPQREIDGDDDDDRAPLPFFRGRAREDVRPRPLFRFFGDQD